MRKKRSKKTKSIAWNIKHGATAYPRVCMKLTSWLCPLDQANLWKLGKYREPWN